MNFFQISTSSVSQIFSYITTLFSNLEPLILILLALFIGVWIFGHLTSLALGRARKRFEEAGQSLISSARYKPEWENEPIPFHEATDELTEEERDFEEDEDL
jgi:hypothetical protein